LTEEEWIGKYRKEGKRLPFSEEPSDTEK
jgi:hypothetical protein